jgi:oligopeptide/dipeptide ABC transporter ATP-binding protein
MTALLDVKNLGKHFPVKDAGLFGKQRLLRAVDDVSFTISAGETLGLVGESGCGKSTVGKTLLNLYKPTAGDVLFNGESIYQMDKAQQKALRRRVQMIFQDPMESLNPRHTIGEIIEEPLLIHAIGNRITRQAKIKQLLDRVGLPQDALDRYPHEFSGGQRQRIGIARAIALEPELIICDEPVSALDVSVQSQILNLLLDLQQEMGLALLFISHDLNVVRHVSDRIAVMYLGQIVELANAADLFSNPRHPYTQALLQSIPNPFEHDKLQHGAFKGIEGELPSPINPPSGCRFHTRCAYSSAQCKTDMPQLQAETGNITAARFYSCHHPLRG